MLFFRNLIGELVRWFLFIILVLEGEIGESKGEGGLGLVLVIEELEVSFGVYKIVLIMIVVIMLGFFVVVFVYCRFLEGIREGCIFIL